MTRITGIYKDENRQLETIEMDVKSEMWRRTTAVIDIKTFRTGRRVFPCGSGEDYRLTNDDVRRINEIIESEGE